MDHPRRARAPRVVSVAAALACAAAALLPWHRSGAVDRSGYQLARSAHRLGLVDDGFERVVLELWRSLPLLAAVALALVLFQRSRAAAAVAVGAGAVSGLAGAVVLTRVPGALPLGPWVAVAAAAVAVVAGAWTIVTVRGASGGGARPPA